LEKKKIKGAFFLCICASPGDSFLNLGNMPTRWGIGPIQYKSADVMWKRPSDKCSGGVWPENVSVGEECQCRTAIESELERKEERKCLLQI